MYAVMISYMQKLNGQEMTSVASNYHFQGGIFTPLCTKLVIKFHYIVFIYYSLVLC